MFKADHGMTDSHGSSVVEETSTPIVVWGAGIRQPIKVNNEMFSQTAEWDLANILAEYTKPADLTPLMASVIGIDNVSCVETKEKDLLATEANISNNNLNDSPRLINNLRSRKRRLSSGIILFRESGVPNYRLEVDVKFKQNVKILQAYHHTKYKFTSKMRE
ncbi:hypothetical protein CHUAL_013871 [Chamberlinius hualienensis]